MEGVNILNCKNDMEFREWLAENHSSQKECWVNCKRGKPKEDVFSHIDAVTLHFALDGLIRLTV